MASHRVTLTCFISKFLGTEELNVFARTDVVLQRYYVGCYPADVMPPTIKKSCCWIWNVDEQDKPGTHWVAIVKEDRNIFFFDSFGKTPQFFKRQYWLDNFRTRGWHVTMVNNAQIQAHVSRTCGVWCLYYLRAHYEGRRRMLEPFTNIANQLISNEQRLKKLAFRMFSKMNVIYSKKCDKSKGQICKTYMETYSY